MQGQLPSVIVVGGTYVDMAIRCSQPPTPGQTVAGSALSYTITGPGPNQAAEAAMCGCRVHLISKVGGDPFARTVVDSLSEFNVNTDFVYTAEAKNTGTIVTMVNSGGENAACKYPGANLALGPKDIEAAEQIIAEADVCLIHASLPQDAVVAAIRCAKLQGTKVILNPARPISHLETTETDLASEYFNADILILNLYEAADITDTSAGNSKGSYRGIRG
jgi:ribokinase